MRVGGLAMLALFCCPAPSTAADHAWSIYVNVRFGYGICYPADLMTPQPEADNGDGRLFTTVAGATLRVWGRYNAANESLGALTDDLPERGATITYRHVDAAWSVVSGRKDGRIFYAKTLLEKGKVDTIRSFILTYPQRQAATFDKVAARMSRCFGARAMTTTWCSGFSCPRDSWPDVSSGRRGVGAPLLGPGQMYRHVRAGIASLEADWSSACAEPSSECRSAMSGSAPPRSAWAWRTSTFPRWSQTRPPPATRLFS